MEIRDADNQLIFGDLGSAGLQLAIQGVAPFRIVVGNTSAVTVQYQGELIDLKPHTTSRQTAILKVGEA